MMEILSYIVGWATTTIGQLHLAVAIIALFVGPVTFFSGKGSTNHRWAGYVFIIAMLITNITALTSYNLTSGFNLFHFFALASLATLFAAIRYLRQAIKSKSEKSFIAHGILMSWTYFGLIAAFIAEVYTRELPYMLHGEGGWVRFTVSITLFCCIVGWGVFKVTSKMIPKIVRSSSKNNE